MCIIHKRFGSMLMGCFSITQNQHFLPTTHCLHCKTRAFPQIWSTAARVCTLAVVYSGLQMTFGTRQAPLWVIKWNGQTATTPIFQQQQHDPYLGWHQAHCAHTHNTTHNNNTQGIRLFYYFATRLMAQDHAITSLCTGHLLGARRETTPWFIGQPWLIK